MAHLPGQLTEKSTNDLQDVTPLRSEGVLTSCAKAAIGVTPASQPPSRLHPTQHRIERPGTHAIAMFAKLLEHPLPHDVALGGVVQDMDLPEAQKDLTPGGGQVALGSRARNARSSHLAQYCSFRYRNQ
jgi:hypothetical protein